MIPGMHSRHLWGIACLFLGVRRVFGFGVWDLGVWKRNLSLGGTRMAHVRNTYQNGFFSSGVDSGNGSVMWMS